MKTVYLKVDEEIVDGAGKVVGAEGTTSTDILVEFSEDWEPLSKYATTRDAKGLHPEVIVITELMKEPIGEEEEERFAYRFTLSGNATCEEGLMSITFTGYEIENGNETQTLTNTAMAKLRVLPSDYAEMDDGSVTPTIAQQLQSEIDDIKEDITIATHAQEYAEAAEGSASDAAGSAESAEGYASNAEDYATLSRSYARGDTDTRQGEETDNAKYYKELAEQYAGVFVVEDNLESTSATHSLSANQGRVLDGKITDILNSVGEASGIASLDSTGRIPYTQLPESAMEYKGTWNASTNTPTLTQGVGDSGDFYVVSTAGTWSGITFNVNDRVIYDGDQELWVRLGAGEVISVNNKSGVVTLNADDIPFDPTGSTLLSTNTEDAIKEAARVGGGMVAKFNITSDAGSTVTVTMPSGTTVTATQKTGSTTEWEANTAEYGTHTLTATLNGQTATTTVVVDTCKVYSVNALHNPVPDGSTVTPTDDVQTWLHCAEIFDKAYTTLVDVLADTDTLVALMANDNACDYLVRSTTWVTDIVADSGAMLAIGASDYCAETLLENSTWRSAIGGSTYAESVLNVKVPEMTSNTAPSGVASASNTYDRYAPYKAFNDTTSEGGFVYGWIGTGNTSSSNEWVGYTFPTAKKIYYATYTADSASYFQSGSYKVQGVNEGVATDLSEDYSTYSANIVLSKNIDNYETYRIYFNSYVGTSNVATPRALRIQFYGRQDGGVQTWLHEADITDKDYTTLAEVLADSTTLSALMASQDAVDYMVGCTEWADTICADQTAMSYIGLNNYCANTLLADSTWFNAICNSTYFESVLNVKVPTMTSDTTPSGEVIYSTQFSTSYGGSKAFDNSLTFWSTTNNSITNQYIGYTFTSSKKIKVVKIIGNSNRNINIMKNFYIEYLDSGNTWQRASEQITFPNTTCTGSEVTEERYILSSDITAQAWRIYILNNWSGEQINVYEVQFYGREDV